MDFDIYFLVRARHPRKEKNQTRRHTVAAYNSQ